MTHTQGPWRARELTSESPGTRIYKGTAEIATCHYGAPFDHQEAKANARLIAAAPELLAAMKWIAEEIEWNHDMGGVLAVARRAIEKATGQETPCTS